MPNFIYLFNKYPYWIFQTCSIISIFFPSKCRLLHNATLFGFCITHILNTGCAKIWKKKSVAKRLRATTRICKTAKYGPAQSEGRVYTQPYCWGCINFLVTLTVQATQWLGNGLYNLRAESRHEKYIFSTSKRAERFWSTSSLLFSGYCEVLSSGTKRPGHEADHSPPFSAVHSRNMSSWSAKWRLSFTFLFILLFWWVSKLNSVKTNIFSVAGCHPRINPRSTTVPFS